MNQLFSSSLGMRRLATMMIAIIGLLVVLMAVESASSAQPNVKSYIVVMELDPIIAYEGDMKGYPATKPGNGKKVNPNSAHVKKYQKLLEESQVESLEAAGASAGQQVNSYTFALSGYSAILTEQEAKAIEGQDGVLMVMEDELRQPMTESSPDFLGLTAPAGAWATGYDGEGVIVGVIDNGIWPEHPSFADDGSYSDLGIVLDDSEYPACDFGNTAQNENDVPFECNNKLIGARQVMPTYRLLIGADPDEFDSARDDNGHGTHTASTAAGNSGVESTVLGVPRGTVSGVAPRARIIAYKGLGKLGGFGSDLALAIDQAVADGVDVINYSIGSSSFAVGPDDIAFLFAADAGVHVATSNGNSGPGPATTGSPASVPWLTSVGASTQPRSFLGSTSSSDGWEFFGASITGGTEELPLVDAEDLGNPLCLSSVPFNDDVSGKIVLCLRGAVARVQKSFTVFNAGGAGMIHYNASDAQSTASDAHWVPSVHINNTDGLVIKAYIDSAGADAVAQINGGEATTVDAPNMAGFSSRGPNRLSSDIIKPDITGPGVQILAGASPLPYDEGFPAVQGELFQAISGTSMSSPHVAGVFALLKQANPDWTPAMSKSAIMTTSYREVNKEDGVTPADPFDFGAGHVNPGSPVHKGSAFQPGLVYDTGLFEYAAFTCGADLGVFSSGTCAFLESLGIPMDPSDLNLPSIGIGELPGSQTVQRTVTSVAKENGWREYTVSVDAPAGYDVTVEPSTIRLKSGDSATYFVTITNDGTGSADEWSHGSLTWTDQTGNYDVYSPISVKTALINAPAAINGAGVDGSASFNIDFGYTGDYTAAAHGLEAATVINDNVPQDPDQTFNPNDGFSDRWDVTTSGAALLRVAMPPDAVPNPDVDIDIFVLNSAGQLVGQSTNGATNELIDLVLPADDTYSIYVQGWQAGGPNTDYTLYYWVVSATPGGNMMIDSAPSSATIGASDSVDVSWTGAAAGEWHLGAVSHADGAGLLGLTLVEVDNR